jgi:hypothetical protein
VLFLEKNPIPEESEEDKTEFAQLLATVGVSLREYAASYSQENEER